MITAIIGWIVFGLIIGAIARFVVPGPDPMGIVGTILLGVVGSFVGGFLSSLIFGGPEGASVGLYAASYLGSFLGAVLCLVGLPRLTR